MHEATKHLLVSAGYSAISSAAVEGSGADRMSQGVHLAPTGRLAASYALPLVVLVAAAAILVLHLVGPDVVALSVIALAAVLVARHQAAVALARHHAARATALEAAIEERQRAQAALQEQARLLDQRLREAERLAALGTLASGVAHDFNNILGAILGYGNMVYRATAEGSASRRHAATVLTAAQRAKALVDQVLDYGRSQRGLRGPVDIAAMVGETLDLLRASLPRGIQVEVRGAAEPLVVQCNPTHVHQIVMNLCTNAIHAMREGGTLRVGSRRHDTPTPRALSQGTLPAGSYVELSISDTGSGMTPELLKRVFEPFFTTKCPGTGTGLGLALVQSIVSELGGAVDLTSAPGQGTAFRIYLPRDAVAEAATPSFGQASGQPVTALDNEESPALVLLPSLRAANASSSVPVLHPATEPATVTRLKAGAAYRASAPARAAMEPATCA